MLGGVGGCVFVATNSNVLVEGSEGSSYHACFDMAAGCFGRYRVSLLADA